MPTYNEEDYLDRKLRSIIGMDCDPTFYEIIIVDNNSTDRTKELAEKFAKTHPKCALYVVGEHHRGTVYARKLGSDLAVLRGAAIIAHTDTDKVLAVDWASKIIKAFDDPRLSALRGGYVPNLQEAVERVNAIMDYHKIEDRETWINEFRQHLSMMGSLFKKLAGLSNDPDLQETPGMLACGNCAFTTEAYCAVGGYDLGEYMCEGKRLGDKIHATGRQVVYREDVQAQLSPRRNIRHDGRTLLAESVGDMHASHDFSSVVIPKMTLDDFRTVWLEERKEGMKKILNYNLLQSDEM